MIGGSAWQLLGLRGADGAGLMRVLFTSRAQAPYVIRTKPDLRVCFTWIFVLIKHRRRRGRPSGALL